MRRTWIATVLVVAGAVAAAASTMWPSLTAAVAAEEQAAGNLVVYGDMTLFAGRGKRENCTLRNRYGRGEPVGFRMTAIDPATGQRSESAELVVHLNYNGQTVDIPMRYRATEQQPQLTFWVAKWIVPDDAPYGIIRYTVTARDAGGRTGTFTPFDNDQSQLTIVP